MLYQDNNDALAKFGIDEIYIHENLTYDLLEKLQQRALFSLDGEDDIIRKYASHDMIFIFHKLNPTPGLIYRFLKFLDQDANKKNFVKSNTLVNEEELFSAIKSKKYVLITHRTLVKETYTPD